MASTLTDVMISGVKVKFPSKPYPSQISMMDKIIKGLQRKQNCLLESPTGSGKSLALLCSALAWQFHEKNSCNTNTDSKSKDDDVNVQCFCDCAKKLNAKLNDRLNDLVNKLKKKPGIKYEDDNDDNHDDDEKANEKNEKQKTTNELHDEANQCPCVCHGMYALNKEESKKKVPTIYFGTRTHKQIANIIKELSKTIYSKDVQMTILSSRQHTCIHPQISKSARKNDLCKELVKKAEPGCNYLHKWKKQPLSYDTMGFDQNIWDIEDIVKIGKRKKICPYYASRDLTAIVDIIFCPYNYLIDPRIRSSMSINLNDQVVILDEAHNIEDACRESTSFLITKLQLDFAREELEKAVGLAMADEICDSIAYFGRVFDKLSAWIDRCSANFEYNDFDSAMSRIWNGIEIVAEFKLQGIGPDNFMVFQQKANKLFGEEKSENVSDATKLLIEHLMLILEFLYTDNHEFMDDYRVAITKTKIDELPKDDLEDEPSRTFRSTQNTIKWTYTINFWCLNPCVAFNYLKKCHSVILCSGTLSPMETFQSELGVKFENQLEANHVISDKQVWVGSLGYGPTDTNLMATFKNCETYSFQDEIGRLIIDICKTVPFGVLCFLPSYTLLNKLLNRWNQNNMIETIEQYKTVFSESRVAKDFNDLLQEFYASIERSNATEKKNGSLLLAVYRGRASEGLDFSDNYARAVIAVGIPYPNVKDVQVDLKRKYNNNLCSKKNLLNGDEWYEIQAYRAVNQALGRCIRHRNDWGAIILVDDRYFRQPQKYSKGLSKWIRQRYHTYRSYQEALESLKKFVNEMKDFNKNSSNTTISQFSETKINDVTNTVNNDENSYISQIKSTYDGNITAKQEINDENSEYFSLKNEKSTTQDKQEKSLEDKFMNPLISKILATKEEINKTSSITSPNNLMLRKRPRERQPKIDEIKQANKKQSVNIGTFFNSKPEFTNFNQISQISSTNNKASIDKGDYINLTSDEDDIDDEIDFESDFKQIKQLTKKPHHNDTNDGNNSTILINDCDDDFSDRITSTAKNEPTITSTNQKSKVKTQAKAIKESPPTQINVTSPMRATTTQSTTCKTPIAVGKNNKKHLNCIHCGEYICDLSTNKDPSGSMLKFDDLNFNCKLIETIMNSLNCKHMLPITNNMDKIAFQSNTCIKTFITDQVSFNSFSDDTNCWQFIECNSCTQIVAFTLKFTNSSAFNIFINKLLLICQ